MKTNLNYSLIGREEEIIKLLFEIMLEDPLFKGFGSSASSTGVSYRASVSRTQDFDKYSGECREDGTLVTVSISQDPGNDIARKFCVNIEKIRAIIQYGKLLSLDIPTFYIIVDRGNLREYELMKKYGDKLNKCIAQAVLNTP